MGTIHFLFDLSQKGWLEHHSFEFFHQIKMGNGRKLSIYELSSEELGIGGISVEKLLRTLNFFFKFKVIIKHLEPVPNGW